MLTGRALCHRQESPLTGFLIRRALSGLLALFLLMTGIFFLGQIVMPGDYVSQMVLQLSLAEAEPLRQQYLLWLQSTALNVDSAVLNLLPYLIPTVLGFAPKCSGLLYSGVYQPIG
jgi:ABC-type dipeptide/oligopeptide/nickel transport system permease component